jgi:hypothetical protein
MPPCPAAHCLFVFMCSLLARGHCVLQTHAQIPINNYIVWHMQTIALCALRAHNKTMRCAQSLSKAAALNTHSAQIQPRRIRLIETVSTCATKRKSTVCQTIDVDCRVRLQVAFSNHGNFILTSFSLTFNIICKLNLAIY